MVAGFAILLFVATSEVSLIVLAVTFDLDIHLVGTVSESVYFCIFLAWAVVAVVGAAILSNRLRWRRARIDRPECIHCRYNLTANESGTCPECGNPIHPRQAAWLAEHADPSAPISIHLRPISSKEGTADERG